MTEFGLWVYNGGWWILLTVGVLLAMAAVMTGLVFNTKGLSDELSGRTRRREIERLKRKYAGMRDEDIEGRMRELVEPLETASDGPVASVPSPVSVAASAPVYGAVAPVGGGAVPAAGRGSVVAELKASIYGYDEEDEEEKTGVFTPETLEDTAAGRVQFDAQGVELPRRVEEPVVQSAQFDAQGVELPRHAEEPVVQSAQFDAQGVELPQRAEEAQQAEGLQRSEVEDQPAKRLGSLTMEVPQEPTPGIPQILPVTLEHEEEEQTSVDLTAVEDTEAETSVDLTAVEDTEAETSVDLTAVKEAEAETSVDLTPVEESEAEAETSVDLTPVEESEAEAETSVDLSEDPATLQAKEEDEAETSVDLTEDPTALQTQEELDEYPTEEFKKTSELPRVYLLDMPTSASAIRLNTAGLGILAEAYSTGSYDPVTGETRKRDTAEGETGTSFVSQL
jgi:hypothetical protein